MVANCLKPWNIVQRLRPKSLAASSAFWPSLVMRLRDFASMSGDHFIGGPARVKARSLMTKDDQNADNAAKVSGLSRRTIFPA